ncbi:MAG: histidinol dehydrogenase [Flavobacteriaceae bacterium]|nr:histidinol dehydrogenase [Flavobacteriaceae bacterium]MCI5087572.1 histidinol dehydrogenase [Flavobacteriaceae bacterium]
MEVYNNPNPEDWESLLKRPTASYEALEPVVSEVFGEVALKGDEALKRYTEKFDGISLSTIPVDESEIQAASKGVSEALKQAITQAKDQITAFHLAQKTPTISVENIPGVLCWQEKRPIEKVGIYIPGGSAPLFSTILMLAVPAQLAGCKEIILCTPPNKEGGVHPAILFTAALCGISMIFKVGGIQAIAAMTYGTPQIPKVYKIFGPGNQYVTVAKQWATKQGVAIDMPAGPSELLVMADQTANAAFIASDLLSQAEHGADSQVIFVTTYEPLLAQVAEELERQLKNLPRKEIAVQAIANSKSFFMPNKEAAVALVNSYAPEHYILCVSDEDYYLSNLTAAGSVFVGNYSPESAGDYASGTNHTLPTNGYARQYSGVNLDAFLKQMTFQKLTAHGLEQLGETIELMAAAEGLEAHKNAVSIRLAAIKNNNKT